MTGSVTEVEQRNSEGYWERKEEMEKLFNKAMEVEDEYKKPH